MKKSDTIRGKCYWLKDQPSLLKVQYEDEDVLLENALKISVIWISKKKKNLLKKNHPISKRFKRNNFIVSP